MRSERTIVAMLVALGALTAWPASAGGQTQTDLSLPGRPSAVGVLGVVVPPSVLQAGRPVRELSVDEAIVLALEQNLDLRVERLNPLIEDVRIAEARSVYAPLLATTLAQRNRTYPATSIFVGSESTNTDESLRNNLDLSQAVPWAGGSYSATWDGSRATSTNTFFAFDPLLESNVFLQYNQPLLRNLGIDSSRLQIAITRANRDISEIALRATIVRTQRAVRLAYWSLHYAYVSLDVARQSLELAEDSLRNTRRRVEVGTVPGSDIVQAESEVARNEEGVIVAQVQLDDAEDTLRTLVFDPDAPDFWSIQIQPSDDPTLQAEPIDVDAAIRNAQNNRTDLDTLDKQIENTDTNIRYYRNQRLPDVDLQVNYSLNGAGGTELLRDEGFLGPVTGQAVTSFGSVLGDIFSNDFPTWRVGVTMRYELGNSFAKANLQRVRLERTQADGRRRSLEVRIAQEVRAAGRSVIANRQRVDATQTAQGLAERRLEAEQRQLDLGLTPPFFVVQAQRDLALARNNLARAVLFYTQSLVDFEAVQEVSLFGGF